MFEFALEFDELHPADLVRAACSPYVLSRCTIVHGHRLTRRSRQACVRLGAILPPTLHRLLALLGPSLLSASVFFPSSITLPRCQIAIRLIAFAVVLVCRIGECTLSWLAVSSALSARMSASKFARQGVTSSSCLGFAELVEFIEGYAEREIEDLREVRQPSLHAQVCTLFLPLTVEYFVSSPAGHLVERIVADAKAQHHDIAATPIRKFPQSYVSLSSRLTYASQEASLHQGSGG